MKLSKVILLLCLLAQPLSTRADAWDSKPWSLEKIEAQEKQLNLKRDKFMHRKIEAPGGDYRIALERDPQRKNQWRILIVRNMHPGYSDNLFPPDKVYIEIEKWTKLKKVIDGLLELNQLGEFTPPPVVI